MNIIDPTKRFSDKVDDYSKYRPGYPKEIISFFNRKINLKNKIIADIGAGTGILTELFLENGNEVFAIEPNSNMLDRAKLRFMNYEKNINYLANAAEKTGLSDKSVDVIAVAQAFHWFDTEKCVEEFYRILKEDGCILLIWNIFKENEFYKEYKNLYSKYSNEYNIVNHDVDEKELKKIFAPNSIYKQEFYNNQILDRNGFIGRICSSSFSPKSTDKFYENFLSDATNIFNKFQINKKIKIKYDTLVYYIMI